jgi:hypothetical protein
MLAVIIMPFKPQTLNVKTNDEINLEVTVIIYDLHVAGNYLKRLHWNNALYFLFLHSFVKLGKRM